MKVKEGFLKRQIGDRVVVVPIGEASNDFHGMINLNETAGEMWELLQEETDEERVLNAIMEKYEVEYDRAKNSLEKFLNDLRDAGVLEEIRRSE